MSVRHLAFLIVAVGLLLIALLFRDGDTESNDLGLPPSSEQSAEEPSPSELPVEMQRNAPVFDPLEFHEIEATHGVFGLVVGPLGEPLEGARVAAAIWPHVDAPLATTLSDEEGGFAFRGLPSDGFKWITAEADSMTTGRAVARIPDGALETFVTMRLWEGANVYGRVTNPEGFSVAGAEVVGTNDYSWVDGGFRPPQARTDENGEYRLEGLPVGRFAVRVHAPGLMMGEHFGFNVDEVRVDFRLARTGGVRIEALIEGLPETSSAWPTLRIYPMRRGGGFAVPRSIETLTFDRDGRAVIDGLIDAEWVLTMPELEGWIFEPREFRFEAGAKSHHATYKAFQIGSTILRGRLRSESGVALAGEELVCRTQRSQSMNGGLPGRAKTDEEGRFEMIAPLAPGEPFSLHLTKSKYVLKQTKQPDHTGAHDERYLVRYEGRADPVESLELTAVEAAFVSGRLIDTDVKPIPFQWMELQVARGSQGSWSDVAYATSLPNGSFSFPGVHGLGKTMRVWSSGSHGSGSVEFLLAPGQSIDDVEVVLTKTGSVRGTVLDESGLPAVGLVVSMGNFELQTGKQTDGSWSSVMTDRQGRFRFPSARPGGHRIDLIRNRGDRLSGIGELFEVKPGEETALNLTLPNRTSTDDR